MTKQLVWSGLAVMTTLLALLVLWLFRIAVVYMLVSLMLAAALRPLVNRLVGRSILARAAWILLYLVALGSIAFLLILTGKFVTEEMQQLALTLSAQDKWILPKWLEGSLFQEVMLARLPPPSQLIEAIAGDRGQLVMPALLGFTQTIASILGGILAITFLSLYWLLSQTHFERLWLSLLPATQRKKARDVWRTVEPYLGAYIRSQVVHGLLVGLLLALGYWALGSPCPALLGLVGAVVSLIPVVGAALSIIPPIFMGMLTGIQLGLFMVIYTLIVLIILGVWVKPLHFNARWDNPILTLIFLIFLANALGLPGVILAAPVSAVCQILWNLLVSHPLSSEAATRVSAIKERQEHIRNTVQAMDEPPIPLITSSLERLTQLIEKAESILVRTLPGEAPVSHITFPRLPEQENTIESALRAGDLDFNKGVYHDESI